MPRILRMMLFGLTVVIAIAFNCCGTTGGVLDCPVYCQNIKHCCESDPDCDPWDSWMMEECLRDCDNMNKLFLSSFLSGSKECFDIPCDQKEDRGQCMSDLEAKCSTATTWPVTRICSKMVTCFPGETPETCSIYYTNIVKCYKPSALNALVTCTERARCESFNDDVDNCLEIELGIVFE